MALSVQRLLLRLLQQIYAGWKSLDALSVDLASRYDVEPERCRTELEALLANLVEMGVVTRNDG